MKLNCFSRSKLNFLWSHCHRFESIAIISYVNRLFYIGWSKMVRTCWFINNTYNYIYPGLDTVDGMQFHFCYLGIVNAKKAILKHDLMLLNILRIDPLLTNMSRRTPKWVWQLFSNYQNKKGNSDIILSTWKFYCFQNAKMWLFGTNQLQSEAKIRFYLGHPLIYWP